MEAPESLIVPSRSNSTALGRSHPTGAADRAVDVVVTPSAISLLSAKNPTAREMHALCNYHRLMPRARGYRTQLTPGPNTAPRGGAYPNQNEAG